jgi:hypothetical protein
MFTEIEIGGKTYRVGHSVRVRVGTGAHGVARSHYWRVVPPGGKVWRKVMQAAAESAPPPHKIEGSQAEFDRYIAGDR